MNESETNPLPSGELAGQVASLQRQVTTLLMALIVISGTLTTFLFYQSHVMKKDIENYRPQAAQVIQMFNKSRPTMEKFIQQLAAYGQSHPDFQPILQKYGIVATPAAAPKK